MKLKDLLVRMQYILEDLELTEELLDNNKYKDAGIVAQQVNVRFKKISDDLNCLDSLVDVNNRIISTQNNINRKLKLINEAKKYGK